MTDKVKRTMLTPEQRVAKLEAALEAAKVKAAAKENKVVNDLLDKRKKLTTRVAKLQADIDIIDSQLRSLGYNNIDEPTISTDTDQFSEGTFV
jgi:hypothetical protein